MSRTYIPIGCDQQGRRTPTPLTAGVLRPALLLASGAVQGPYRRQKPLFRMPSRMPTLTRPRAQLAEFIETYALYRRGGNTRRYSARIAYGYAFRGLPF